MNSGINGSLLDLTESLFYTRRQRVSWMENLPIGNLQNISEIVLHKDLC